MSNELGVATVYKACPICGKVNESESEILVSTKPLSKKCNSEVRALHNKVVGFSKKPCKTCQEYLDKGAFFIIGVIEEKCEEGQLPYRSGDLVGITKTSDFYKNLPDEYKKKDAMFMDVKLMKQIGLIKDKQDE